MTASAPLDEAWNYPLFEALYGRRSRRFGLGFEMQEGPFRYKSAHAPVPLTELEEALLVGAGAGFTGLAFWDLPTPAPYPHRSGRTFPTTRGASGNTALFFTNDDGFYVLDDKVAAEKLRWPGSTLFLPVCDVSASLITLIAQFVDPALRRYAPASGGMNIVDDRRGFRPAGTEHWVKGGFLNAEKVLPVSIIERQACYYVFSEPAAICQNMFLATEALGLGGWKHCGFLSLEIFQRMGFRIVATEGGSGFGNPIGLDGVFEASCPPYYPTMDAAVDAFFARTPREATAPVPHRMSDEDHRAGTVRISAEGLACTKAVCNYIYDTYGRFPGSIDAMHLMWVMQVHHIDTDYYDRFFGAGAYGPTHAAHMATWHR